MKTRFSSLFVLSIVALTTAQQKEQEEGVLWSIREVDELRATATNVQRPDGSNLDIVGNVGVCSINVLLGYGSRFRGNFAHLTTVVLAAQHLNTGNGSIVSDVAGLNDRCPIRFTAEAANNDFSVDTSLELIIDRSRRPLSGPDPLPCAFIGDTRSSITIPSSVVTGVLGYPQISMGATSSVLDDKEQFKLFGRTIPSDTSNAVPLIVYLHEVLKIKHLAVLNENTAYGNAFVEGMRTAAKEFAPGLVMTQIPMNINEFSIQQGIQALKRTEFRFIFALFSGGEEHDMLMTEAYNQGVAGTGLHQWFYGDAFGGVEGTIYDKDSPLAKAYQGAGVLEVAGGIPGRSVYDNYVETLQEIKNPVDQAWLNNTKLPPDNGGQVYHPGFLNPPSLFNPFTYEAAISIGLSACEAVREDLTLDGEEHYAAFRRTTFNGITGRVAFHNVTGSRDPSSTSYNVDNYVMTLNPDNTSQVTFEKVVTHLFENSEWEQLQNFIYNDGTSNVPIDKAPPPEEETINVVLLAGVCGFFLAVLIILYFIVREQKRKSNDSVWKVKKEELHFADPPKVLGEGTFGLVLLAEYRGTSVAVKRVLPRAESVGRRDSNSGSKKDNYFFKGFDRNSPVVDSDEQLVDGSDNGFSSRMNTKGSLGSGLGVSGSRSRSNSRSASRSAVSLIVGKVSGTTHRKLREDFVHEMRYLSRLRHPCVTTVMGAVIDKKEEPMLIMEFMEHGSLHELLRNETIILDGEVVMPILRDVTQGIRFLHSANPEVIHGDLKAKNILVDTRFRAKVADFGLSQKKQIGGTGTPYWMAPELLRCESVNTTASDVYSFGVILYEVYSRKDPYIGENAKEVLQAVADKHMRKRPGVPKNMPEKIKSLMTDCLEEDARARPSFEELDTRLKRIGIEISEEASSKTQVSLFDIFPHHVAEALRDGRKVEAERKEEVTIFFSDIVGFTNISSTLDPIKVANMLDRLYFRFDELSDKYEIYKVETIGDAWMGVSNLVSEQSSDHTKRIAEFSIEAIKAANQTAVDLDDPSRGFVNIRIGFHVGSVVADVVGNRNPRYCLFGDAVNTSARMESNSKKNRINCSSSAARKLRVQFPELPLACRGELNVKGKGKMICYWVNEEGGLPEPVKPEPEKSMGLRKEQPLAPLQEVSVEFGSEDFKKLDARIKSRVAGQGSSSRGNGQLGTSF